LLQAEKKVKELQGELDDLSQRLDEAGGATQAQVRLLCVINLKKLTAEHVSLKRINTVYR